MLVGTYRYSIDIKNRICIPPKFRSDLGGHCVISKDIADNCVNLYSLDQWEKYTADIEKLPRIEMRKLRKEIYANSDEMDLDSNGRIILNQQICAKVGLAGEKEAIIIGHYTHAQIWNVSEWEKYENDLNSEKTRESIVNKLIEIGF